MPPVVIDTNCLLQIIPRHINVAQISRITQIFLNTNRTNLTNLFKVFVLFDFLEILGINLQTYFRNKYFLLDFRKILSEATR